VLLDPSTPNAAKVMKIISRFEKDVLEPHMVAGNIIARNMYDELPLPWNVSPPVQEFPQSQYVEHKYDRDGKLSNGISFFGGGKKTTIAEIEAGIATVGMITRWRAANPELVGTDKDAVSVLVQELREALGGQDWVERGSGVAILLFKKSV
jgi:hypothetical protein